MSDKPMTFVEHKEQTAQDCEQIATIMTDLAVQVREGDMAQFEAMWFTGGTEEGDAKIHQLRELILLRHSCRVEDIDSTR